jgi:hypothetical protein
MLRLLPLVEAVSQLIINNGKNGNKASFDTGAPFLTITPKQMRWLHIQPEAGFVCAKNSIKPGRRVSSNVSSAFALSPAFWWLLALHEIYRALRETDRIPWRVEEPSSRVIREPRCDYGQILAGPLKH